MGQNLLLNVADHKEFNVVAFNRTVSKVDRFMENEAKGLSMPIPPATEQCPFFANAVAKITKTLKELILWRNSS